MAANSQITIPGFSAEQVNALATLINDVLDKALDKRFGLLPPHQNHAVTVPQPAQPSKQEQEPVLQQANTENTAEKAVSSSNAITVNTGTPSTVPYQTTMQYGRELTINSSNASLLASFLAFFFASLLASLPSYIRFAKDMEATGQG